MASNGMSKIGIGWKQHVETEYTEICEQKRRKQADAAKTAWNQNW